jgi:hypothetical protein
MAKYYDQHNKIRYKMLNELKQKAKEDTWSGNLGWVGFQVTLWWSDSEKGERDFKTE